MKQNVEHENYNIYSVNLTIHFSLLYMELNLFYKVFKYINERLVDHMKVGIDLGTTNSAVAYINENVAAEIIPNSEGERTTPSVILMDGNKAIVGKIAKEASVTQAMGGILFIDEAYALASGGEQDFGKEAIATLIKAMEDYRGSISIILAGYENAMGHFLTTNEGLRSRFNKTIHFNDYSVQELYAILLHIMNEKGFQLTEKAKNTLKDYIVKSCVNVDGNGRFIRNLVEELIQIQSDRVFIEDTEDLLTIHETDVKNYLNRANV